MQIKTINIDNFKRIDSVSLNLKKINYLVGGNNSGKSSVLQAIHMAISCAKLSVERSERVIPESELRYSPTSEFILLGHQAPYENKAGGSRGRVEFVGELDDGTQASYRIEIYKGRNYGSVGVDRTGVYAGFGQEITDPKSLFSIYVPGLSGIPHREEFKNYASVFLKAAGGDANLVLRNIIRILYEEKKIDEVNALLNELLGHCSIFVNHDTRNDAYIDVKISMGGGTKVPVDLVGTGVLQIIQIVSYVALFKPKILLIDEPDNHLHPSRQALLSKILGRISLDYDSVVIVSTHSRHMVTSAPEDANIIWMKDGKVEAEECRDIANVLMDLGALDQIDSKGAEIIICTEDKGKGLLEACIRSVGAESRVKVIAYNGISNSASSLAISAMCDLFPSKPRIIVHRDRDFLTDEELEIWGAEYTKRGIELFSPPLSDVESYLCLPSHVSAVYGISVAQAESIVSEIHRDQAKELRKKFRSKRQEAVTKYWKDGGGPATADLWPEDLPASIETSLGKQMVSLLNERMQKEPGGRKNLQSVVPQELERLIKEAIGMQ